MDFSIPSGLLEEQDRFKGFLKEHLEPNLSAWYRQGAVPREFHRAMGAGRWFGFEMEGGRLFIALEKANTPPSRPPKHKPLATCPR